MPEKKKPDLTPEEFMNMMVTAQTALLAQTNAIGMLVDEMHHKMLGEGRTRCFDDLYRYQLEYWSKILSRAKDRREALALALLDFLDGK